MQKSALITGGNSGIGYDTAKLLKKKGYFVYISGKNSKSLLKASEDLSVKPILCDMQNLEHIRQTAANFLSKGLDVLINNAGIAIPKPITEITIDNFSDSFNTNVRGPLFMIKELVPALSMRNGCVINVSSVITQKGAVNASVYAATKGSVDAFTRALALELAPKKIRVNAVSPGLIETPIFDKRQLTKEEIFLLKQNHTSRIPLKRLGDAKEVAHVIWSLIESNYATGAIWNIDGGFSAG